MDHVRHLESSRSVLMNIICTCTQYVSNFHLDRFLSRHNSTPDQLLVGYHQNPWNDPNHYVWGRGPYARHMGYGKGIQDATYVLAEAEHDQF